MTPRPVEEWVGRRPESMPTDKVRRRVGASQGELCACGCTHVFNYDIDQIDCDHILALKDGGENRESNLQLLLRVHHVTKTNAENTARAIAERHRAKAFKHQKPPSFPTNRNGKFKKRMDGTVELRPMRQTSRNT